MVVCNILAGDRSIRGLKLYTISITSGPLFPKIPEISSEVGGSINEITILLLIYASIFLISSVCIA